jgi:uncharacterized damage-inducible protein DinB
MQPAEGLTVLNFLIHSAENEHATTAKVLAAVPAEGSDYSPDPRSMKAIDLAWHIASAEIFFMTGAAAGEFPQGDGKRPDSLKTPADIAAWYREQFAATLPKLKGMTGEDCVRMINFHDLFNFPAIVYVNLMINHSIHHRGQLSAYLRPMGGRVPSIYGGSADEPIAARAATAEQS